MRNKGVSCAPGGIVLKSLSDTRLSTNQKKGLPDFQSMKVPGHKNEKNKSYLGKTLALLLRSADGNHTADKPDRLYLRNHYSSGNCINCDRAVFYYTLSPNRSCGSDRRSRAYERTMRNPCRIILRSEIRVVSLRLSDFNSHIRYRHLDNRYRTYSMDY